MNMDEITNLIVDSCNNDYTLNEKIRYVYITLGKYLTKNTTFFLSVYKKLGDKNLTKQDLIDIYNDPGNNRQAICRSAANILKKIYDKLGIESVVMDTIKTTPIMKDDDSYQIHHSFLLVIGDDNKKYFLTLVPDLPNIQANLKTRHFATPIAYTIEDDKGNKMQAYEGEKIDFTVMPAEELKRIDEKIGYCKNLYFSQNGKIRDYADKDIQILKDCYKSNVEYKNFLEENTIFYQTIMETTHNNENVSLTDVNISEITSSEWQNFILKVCAFIQEKIEKLTNQKINYIIPPIITNEYQIYQNNNFDFESWYSYVNNILQSAGSEEAIKLLKSSKGMYEFVKKFDSEEYRNITSNNKEKLEERRIKSEKFMDFLHRLSYCFVEEYYLPSEKSTNVANKFNFIFPMLFNEHGTVHFDLMGYAEIIDIIDRVLLVVFPEVNAKGIDGIPNIRKRINHCALLNKDTNEYEILYQITGDKTYFFKFNPKTYAFDSNLNFLDIKMKYIIASDTFKNEIEQLENIEKSNSKI